MTAAAFLRHAGRLLARTPLDKIRITRVANLIPRLAASPHLGRVARLDLVGNGIDSRVAQTLAESPYLRQVREIDLSFNRIGATGVRAVLDATAGAGRR